MPNPDYVDSPDNIFGDDYMSDSLFGEEDEEVGSDFHEIDISNPAKADANLTAYAEKRYDEISGTPSGITGRVLPSDKKPRVRGKLPPKMIKNGVRKLIMIKDDKVIILLP